VAVSDLEIWRHATNIIQRASYGVNGKKHFDLQKERTANMAKGGNGGEPGNAIMIDISDHEGTIRQMHFDDWLDADFQKVLDIIHTWESEGILPSKPAEKILTPLENVVERAYDIFLGLDRDDQVDALNTLAEKLGVMGEDEEDAE
tara:strand:- start:363 stop:800 length:438 start_codon:yes stop_codon:yes gene_type:complete